MDSTTQNDTDYALMLEEEKTEQSNERYPFVLFAENVDGDAKGGNPYLSQLPIIFNPQDPPPIVCAVSGTGKELRGQLQAVQCTGTPFAIVPVREQTMKDPEMQDFLAQEDCKILKLSTPDNGYFGEVLKTCLEGTGFSLPCEQDVKGVITSLRQEYGSNFSEIHVVKACKQAIEKACERKSAKLTAADFMGYDLQASVLDRIQKMIGLEEFKTVLKEFRAVQIASLTNPPLCGMHRSMIFYGNPGTGKTVSARLVADALREAGVGNGVFVEADRASLIGKYVGHTAPKIREIFEKARGGVLFVDEAGFFLTEDGKKGFAGEAIKEFVRYMELYPDVTVIFAMYEKEMNDFLKLDEGLRSRISRRVHFPDYDTEQLCDITEYMLGKYHYELEKGARESLSAFYEKRDITFGNARGARKLTECLITTHCVDAAEMSLTTRNRYVITSDQLNRAIAALSGNDQAMPKRTFGFSAM